MDDDGYPNSATRRFSFWLAVDEPTVHEVWQMVEDAESTEGVVAGLREVAARRLHTDGEMARDFARNGETVHDINFAFMAYMWTDDVDPWWLIFERNGLVQSQVGASEQERQKENSN